MPKYDDVGSLPLPESIPKEEFKRALLGLEDWALKTCRETMEMKIEKGIEVPCYPQLRDMIDQFLEPLKDPDLMEEPYLIRKEEAYIPEVIALKRSAMELPPIKVCVTGPLELSVADFGNKVHEDILLNIARSLNHFIQNVENLKGIDVGVVSIDEPSLGTNSQLIFDTEALMQAWDIAGRTQKKVQVHLHSPLFYEAACKSSGIDIVDIGTAANPGNLETVDPEVVESHAKGVRVGISRTDVLSMGTEFNEKNNVNIWKEDEVNWQGFLDQIDPPSKIAERMEKVYEKFGDLVKYFGPECGLRGSPSRDLAAKIFENTKSGIDLFRSSNMKK